MARRAKKPTPTSSKTSNGTKLAIAAAVGMAGAAAVYFMTRKKKPQIEKFRFSDDKGVCPLCLETIPSSFPENKLTRCSGSGHHPMHRRCARGVHTNACPVCRQKIHVDRQILNLQQGDSDGPLNAGALQEVWDFLDDDDDDDDGIPDQRELKLFKRAIRHHASSFSEKRAKVLLHVEGLDEDDIETFVMKAPQIKFNVFLDLIPKCLKDDHLDFAEFIMNERPKPSTTEIFQTIEREKDYRKAIHHIYKYIMGSPPMKNKYFKRIIVSLLKHDSTTFQAFRFPKDFDLFAPQIMSMPIFNAALQSGKLQQMDSKSETSLMEDFLLNMQNLSDLDDKEMYQYAALMLHQNGFVVNEATWKQTKMKLWHIDDWLDTTNIEPHESSKRRRLS